MNVEITPRTIPGGDASLVRVLSQAAHPGSLRISLSIQQEAIGSRGIVRGHGPPFVVAEKDGVTIRVDDPGRQRQGFLPVVHRSDSHLRRFARARPDRRVVAVTGCGNLLCNPGVEARTHGQRAGVAGFMRAGILVTPDFRGALLEGGRLTAALSVDRGTLAKSPDRFVITGPLLVAGGRTSTPDAREFADLRHLILPAFVEAGRGRRVDFGFDVLLGNPGAARDAAAGRPVTLKLEALLPKGDAVDAPLVHVAISEATLRAALVRKGYREVKRVAQRGEFRVGARHATIAFLPGIYPHHALALDARGGVTSVIVTGRSNREGTTVSDLAAALARAGATAAILLDNGGDVGLLRRRSAAGRAPLVFAARPAESDRARAWPLRACLVFHEAAGR